MSGSETQQQHARTGKPYPSPHDIPFEDLADSVPSYDPFYELEGALDRIIQWYHCLVIASNVIFVLEQKHRAYAAES